MAHGIGRGVTPVIEKKDIWDVISWGAKRHQRMATSLLKIGIQEKLFTKRWEMIHKVMGIYGIAPQGELYTGWYPKP
jgi:hypothetical protein